MSSELCLKTLEEVTDILNVCRVCLCSSPIMYEIFDKQELELNISKQTICDRIYYCTNVLMEAKTILPSKICNACVSSLDIAYNFKDRVARSNKMLMQNIKADRNTQEIKNENSLKLEIDDRKLSSPGIWDDSHFDDTDCITDDNISLKQGKDFIIKTDSIIDHNLISSKDSIVKTSCIMDSNNITDKYLNIPKKEEIKDENIPLFEKNIFPEHDTKYVIKKTDLNTLKNNVKPIKINVNKINLKNLQIFRECTVKKVSKANVEETFIKLEPDTGFIDLTYLDSENCSFEPLDQVLSKKRTHRAVKRKKNSHNDDTDKSRKKKGSKIKLGKRRNPVQKCSYSDIEKLLYKKDSHSNAKDTKQMRVCEHCGMSVLSTSLTVHIKSHFPPTISCDYEDCTYRCWRQTHLRRHKLNRHTQIERSHLCKVCAKGFRSADSLRRHERSVHEEKQRDFKCDYCNKSYYFKDSLTLHIATKHSTVTSYKCEECRKSYTDRQYWRKHMFRSHNVKVPYVCSGKKKNTIITAD